MNAPVESVPVIQADHDAADRAFSEYLRHYVGLQDASKMRFTQEELHGFYRAAWKKRTNQVAELVEAAEAFFAKFDECKPHIDDAFLHRQLRVGDYTGPQLGTELEALRALIVSHKGEQP